MLEDAAMGDLGYERAKLDHYPTPAWVSEAIVPYLLKHIYDGSDVWEPACGDGAMSEVLKRTFNRVISTDVQDYGYPAASPVTDFLKWNGTLKNRSLIITNPPYGDLAEAFIRKALAVTKPGQGVVAMLLRNEYDCSKGRVDLFNQTPFARKIVLTSRPRWIPDSTGAPRHNYAWFIWDHLWIDAPEISYVLRGK